MSSATVRSLEWPTDLEKLEQLDTSFETHSIYEVLRQARGFSIVERSVQPPLRKCYTIDWRELESADAAVVAELDGTLAGVAALEYETWNRRAVISHLYVDRSVRGQGVGQRLLQELQRHAIVLGARVLFAETQNVNVPAIRFYERNDFTLVGLDTSLYDSTADARETALYFVAPLATGGRIAPP